MTKPVAFRSLIDGFVESADRFPSREALVVGGECLSYLALQGLAGKIASAILQHEHEMSPLVALLAHRSKTAYASILGILGAGKGYVPLNPKFPIERKRRMLDLSGCGILIVGTEGFQHLPKLLIDFNRPLTVILPDLFDASGLSSDFPQHRFVPSKRMTDDNKFPLRSEVSPTAIAYLLFTSGSTGQPKGVPIAQSNLGKRRSSLLIYLLPGKGPGTEPEIWSDKAEMVAYTILEEWTIKSKFEAIEWNCKK